MDNMLPASGVAVKLSTMATCSHLLNRLQFRGWPSLVPNHGNSSIPGSFRLCPKRSPGRRSPATTKCRSSIAAGIVTSPSIELSLTDATSSGESFDALEIPNVALNDAQDTLVNAWNFIERVTIADLDPATAKVAIGILGPFLSAFAFLFIVRIVLSWYPKLPLGKFPYVIAYAPTEPLLVPTRKLIPPLGGVDVTPVVWFGLISFLNEILVGPQGLLVLVSQQIN